jgi:nitrous oxidase accessory protein
MGLGLKDASNLEINGNTIIYNAQGFYIDRSPFDPGSKNIIKNNNISYNAEAIHFHSQSENNHITKNDFKGNIEDITNDSRNAKTYSNLFSMNYYDIYEGFDRNGDNIGDTPHKAYQYADKLWLYNENVKFFYGSPVISLLNFLAKLAPFSEPVFLFEDKEPLLTEKG